MISMSSMASTRQFQMRQLQILGIITLSDRFGSWTIGMHYIIYSREEVDTDMTLAPEDPAIVEHSHTHLCQPRKECWAIVNNCSCSDLRTQDCDNYM